MKHVSMSVSTAVCSLFSVTGVYKSHEARLMLLVYHVKASSSTTLSKIKEEQWTLDGFVCANVLLSF